MDWDYIKDVVLFMLLVFVVFALFYLVVSFLVESYDVFTVGFVVGMAVSQVIVANHYENKKKKDEAP